MVRSKIWIGTVFLWRQFCLVPTSKKKAFVNAVLGIGCFRISLEHRELLANTIMSAVDDLINLVGTVSTLLAIINALHKDPKPAMVTPVPTIIKG